MCALTKDEVIAQLQKEVRILLHLASKIDRTSSTTARRRSSAAPSSCCATLVNMGPVLVKADQVGSVRCRGLAGRDREGQRRGLRTGAGDDSRTGSGIRQPARRRGPRPTSAARSRCSAEARRAPHGCSNSCSTGCAAYRTQLFCYLKSCGRDELTTSNLWQGVDAAVPA
jgi:hypothetical protein